MATSKVVGCYFLPFLLRVMAGRGAAREEESNDDHKKETEAVSFFFENKWC
ncbi:hypothetical protein [Bacillus piscicola]|uniref:hypothetical protein n=1 Tax=Bacillus piscicola TaxID=1632684 RepID=UPI001F093AA6|nr:hypothetical protein [Bacillus piscicola]